MNRLVLSTLLLVLFVALAAGRIPGSKSAGNLNRLRTRVWRSRNSGAKANGKAPSQSVGDVARAIQSFDRRIRNPIEAAGAGEGAGAGGAEQQLEKRPDPGVFGEVKEVIKKLMAACEDVEEESPFHDVCEAAAALRAKAGERQSQGDADAGDSPEGPEDPEAPERPEDPDRPERPERPARPGRPERPERLDRPVGDSEDEDAAPAADDE